MIFYSKGSWSMTPRSDLSSTESGKSEESFEGFGRPLASSNPKRKSIGDGGAPAKKSHYNELQFEDLKNIAQRNECRRDVHNEATVAMTDKPVLSEPVTNDPQQMTAQVRSSEKPHQLATSVPHKLDANQSEAKNVTNTRQTGETAVRSVDNHHVRDDFSFAAIVSQPDMECYECFSHRNY